MRAMDPTVESGSMTIYLRKVMALLLVLGIALAACKDDGKPLIRATQPLPLGDPYRALKGEPVCPGDTRNFLGSSVEDRVSVDNGDGTIGSLILDDGLLSCQGGHLLVNVLTADVIGGNYYDNSDSSDQASENVATTGN